MSTVEKKPAGTFTENKQRKINIVSTAVLAPTQDVVSSLYKGQGMKMELVKWSGGRHVQERR